MNNAIALLDRRGDGRDRSDVPFAGSYWIVPGLLLAGSYPGHRDTATMNARCTALVETGVRHVLNLMEGGNQFQRSSDYETTVTAIHAGVVCTREPITDMGVPDVATMDSIINVIDRSMDQRLPIYIHCFAGRGRTGMVVGCWLINHGFADRESVFDVMRRLRSVLPDSYAPSPETADQRTFVRAYKGQSGVPTS